MQVLGRRELVPAGIALLVLHFACLSAAGKIVPAARPTDGIIRDIDGAGAVRAISRDRLPCHVVSVALSHGVGLDSEIDAFLPGQLCRNDPVNNFDPLGLTSENRVIQ